MSITLGVVPHGDPVTQLQFGVHPKRSVSATGLLVDLVDEIS